MKASASQKYKSTPSKPKDEAGGGKSDRGGGGGRRRRRRRRLKRRICRMMLIFAHALPALPKAKHSDTYNDIAPEPRRVGETAN